MAYKRSTDDIDSPKVDGAISISATSTITANGERGTLSFTLNADWLHDGGFGAGNTLVFNNNKILADSCITLALQNDTKCRLYVNTQAAGTAYIIPINYSGVKVDSGQVVKINYRISN
jgi:hypothetical protein